MYRTRNGHLEVLLAHPGGPYFQHKDEGHWTIPKGEPDAGEDLLSVARREFEEETGCKPNGPFITLSPITQKGGKVVHAWAFHGDCDATQCRSNTFRIEWPPRSGKLQEFPEMDRAEWFGLAAARKKIKATQIPFLDELERLAS